MWAKMRCWVGWVVFWSCVCVCVVRVLPLNFLSVQGETFQFFSCVCVLCFFLFLVFCFVFIYSCCAFCLDKGKECRKAYQLDRLYFNCGHSSGNHMKTRRQVQRPAQMASRKILPLSPQMLYFSMANRERKFGNSKTNSLC